MPAADNDIRVYPLSESGGILWSSDLEELSSMDKALINARFAERAIKHQLFEMANLSEEQAEELREAVMNSVNDWLATDLPLQLEKVIRGVCEELLNPGSVRSLRASMERELRPKIRNEVEMKIRNSLAEELEKIRTEIIEHEKESIRHQLRSELTPIVKGELLEDMKKRLFD